MSKPSTPSCSEAGRRTGGATLFEMLVAMAVTSAVTAGALALGLSSRRMYELDEARTRLNQSLRGSRDFLVADLRQAGERLPGSFPAIEIVRGEDLPAGEPGDPDVLILRRNLADTMLRSCRTVAGSEPEIQLAELGEEPPPPGCTPVPDGNGDGWPDNHGTWHAYRLAHGVEVDGAAAVRAYLYDPVDGVGEFFWYGGDDVAEATIEAAAGPSWTRTYPAEHHCQVWLLEERRYALDGDLLTLRIDSDASKTLHLVDGIADFQLRALRRPPPLPAPQDDPPPLDSFGFGYDWTELRAIDIRVVGRVPFKDRTIEREWSAAILPRNVLSR
jgi:type IV pilus assembly protein PilW